MAELKTYRVDLPDGRFVDVRSDKELTEEQKQQVIEMAPPAGETKGPLEAGLTGAATGIAPSAAFLSTLGAVGRATAGSGPMVSIPSSILAGLAAAAATGIGQRKVIEAISPEVAKSIEESARQQPIATMIGGALTSGFRPGVSTAQTELGRIAERAVPAALGGGIQLGTEYLEGGGAGLPEGAAQRIATAGLIGGLTNVETGIAKRLIGNLPRVRPPTPVTDNLGQVKAGESLPSATAKANQMATEGGTAAPSPTEQIKQQTAATEAANRATRKTQEQVLGGFGSETGAGPTVSILGQETPVRPTGARPSTAEEAAALLMGGGGKPAEESAAALQKAAGMKSLEESYNEAEDLIVELQRLTGRSRESIMNSIPDKEIDPMLVYLRAEVAYKKNPLLADVDRRIAELQRQVKFSERRSARQREEAIAKGEAQTAMEEATARATAPESRAVSTTEAPEAAMGEIPGFRDRPAMVTPERNVEVQIIEQTRRNQELRALEDKANRIQADLLQRGVDILPEQARELARMEPAEFNATRQRIIKAVVPEMQGPAPRKPERLKSLAELTPERVGVETPAAPAPMAVATEAAPEAPLSAVSKAVTRRTPRVPRVEAAPAVVAAQAEQARAVPEVVIPATPKAAQAEPVSLQKKLDYLDEQLAAKLLTKEEHAKFVKEAKDAAERSEKSKQTIDEIKTTTSNIDKRIDDAFEQARKNPKFDEWLKLSNEASDANRNAKFLSEHPLDYPPSQRAAATRKATKLFKQLTDLERAAGIPPEASFSPKVKQSLKAAPETPVPAVSRASEAPKAPVPTPEAQMPVKAKETPVPEAPVSEPEAGAAKATGGLTKEEQALNKKIEKTIESLDLARANLEPTSKIVAILRRSGLMNEGEIKLVQGAGKSMGAEDAATEAMSLLEFKRPTARKAEAPAAKTPDEAAAVKAIETGMVEPEVVKPAAPVAAEVSSLVPEAAPAPKPATTTEEKTQKFNRIKEALYKAKGLKPKAPVKEEVATAAAEAIAVTPEAPPAPVEAPAAPKAGRLQVTKGTVFDKPYSFYKKEEGIGVPWFAEVNGVEYPLKARSVGTAKDEAKRLAAEQLRPSGEELGLRALLKAPSPGEPLAGAALGYVTGDTEEDRIERAKKGFLIGGAISLGAQGIGRMANGTVKMTPRGLQTLGAIEAFHGGPTREIKKFDIKFIGKGEGAQVYGFGLYFAQLKETAQKYLQDLSQSVSSFSFTKKGTNEKITISHPILGKYSDKALDEWGTAAAYRNFITEAGEKEIGGNIYKSSNIELLKSILNNPDSVPSSRLKTFVENELLSTAKFGPKYIGKSYVASKDEIAKRVSELRQKIIKFGDSVNWSTGEEILTPTGSLYKVTIDAEPYQMLDWDMPLSRQPQNVQKTIKKALVDSSNYVILDKNNNIIGSDFNYYNALAKAQEVGGTISKPSIDDLNERSGKFIYQTLTRDFLQKLLPDAKLGEKWSPKTSQEKAALNQAAESASALLDYLGIKGIKYKDQFSRVKQTRDDLEVISGSELKNREAQALIEQQEPSLETAFVSEELNSNWQPKWNSKYFIVPKDQFYLEPGALNTDLQKINELSGWASIEEATKALETVPESTRNYVVFNDKNIKVLAENERPISSTGLTSGMRMPSPGEPLAGAAIGYAIGDTEEERRENAILGFKLGSLASLGAMAAGRGMSANLKTLKVTAEQRTAKPTITTTKAINQMPVTNVEPLRESFISQLLKAEKPDSQSVYNKMVADNKINNTGVPSAEVAQHIAGAPVHHQKFLSDIASAFPMITKVPGGQMLSDAIGGAAKLAEAKLGTLVSNIAARSPRAAGAINTLLFEKSKQQAALWENGAQALNDFTKTKLLMEQSNDFWRLARNGDVEGAKAILLTTEGGEAAARNYDLVLEQRRLIREEAKANGIPMGDIGDALPSIVADVDGLLKYLGVEERGRYDRMLNAARKAKAAKLIAAAEEAGTPIPEQLSISLTPDEEVLVMSNYLSGVRSAAGKPGFLKGRSIEAVDKEMDQFYAPGSVALKRYYDKWVDYKLNKQFFGKVRPDMTPNELPGGSIAKILAEEMRNKTLDTEGLKRVNEALRNFFQFDYKFTDKLADKARKIQTFAMLSDISTAVIQFADLFTMAYGYGGPKGVFNAFKPGNRTKLRDISLLENPNVDIDDITKGVPKGGKIGRVVSAAYEAPLKYLLGGADKINKEGLLNSARAYVADIVQKPQTRSFQELESYYSKMYPERWPAMLDDLRKPEFKEGKLTDNTAFFLRNELAKYQPIDLAGRAEGYVAATPWGKTLYTLRSYAIKQLDILRRDVYDNFKKSNQTGEVKYAAKAIANMAAYAMLVGAGQQVFRYGMDEALGRKIEDPKEYAIQGAMGIMLIPRYSIYRLGEQGLFVAGMEWAVPGSGILNDLQQDVRLLGKYFGEQTDVRGFRTVPNIEKLFKGSEMVKFGPGIGKEVYWWVGKGAEKTRKAEEEALQGKERPSTLQSIREIVLPANLKTEMR